MATQTEGRLDVSIPAAERDQPGQAYPVIDGASRARVAFTRHLHLQKLARRAAETAQPGTDLQPNRRPYCDWSCPIYAELRINGATSLDGRTLVWRPDDEPVTVVVLGTEDGD